MSDNDAFATAAHLHVLLRRKTGRVTDTEWMATNPEYAQAMVAFASDWARREGLDDLQRLADKLSSLIPAMSAPVRKPLLIAAAERMAAAQAASEPGAVWPGQHRDSGFQASRMPFVDSEPTRPKSGTGAQRYVGGIR